MTKTLVAFAAVSGLTMSTALAQAPSTPGPAPVTSAVTSSSPQIVNAQASDELLASKLKGTMVIGSDDQKIGEITDILFDKMGHVKAYIVRVGGILGIGAKEVALEPSAFHEVEAKTDQGYPNAAGVLPPAMKVLMTKDEFKQVAEFKPLRKEPTTTGAAPSAPRPLGTGGRTAPSTDK